MLNRANLTLTKVLIFGTLVVLSVSNLYPLLYMLLNSLKTRAAYQTNPFNLPNLQHAAWNNYVTMISQFQIFSLFRNTLIISVCTVTLLLLFGIVASYAFAKLEFKGKNIIYFVIISSMFVPVQVTIIPIYLLLSKVHLVNTYWAVIVTYLGMFLAETILLMTSTFRDTG